MANSPVHADRVREQTTTSGTTSPLELDGPVGGFQTFVDGVGDGQTCSYSIYDDSTGDWEVGFGVVTGASPDTLSRVPYASSNSGSLVSFAAGTKQVFCTPGSRVFPEVGCKATRSSVQTLTTGVITEIAFDEETDGWDPFGMHDTGTDNSRLTIAIPGRYLLQAGWVWEGSAGGTFRLSAFAVNGSLKTFLQPGAGAFGAGSIPILISDIFELDASDYVEVRVQQNSGGDLDVQQFTSGAPMFLTAQRLTP